MQVLFGGLLEGTIVSAACASLGSSVNFLLAKTFLREKALAIELFGQPPVADTTWFRALSANIEKSAQQTDVWPYDARRCPAARTLITMLRTDDEPPSLCLTCAPASVPSLPYKPFGMGTYLRWNPCRKVINVGQQAMMQSERAR